MPLRAGNDYQGCIEIWESRSERHFTWAEIDQINLIADTLVSILVKSQLRQALQESEARNRAFLEALPDLLFRVNWAGTYLDAKIPSNYPQTIPESEIIGKDAFQILPMEVALPFLQAITNTLKTDKMQLIEYDLAQPFGVRTYESRLTVSGKDEVVVIARDVTEARQTQLALQKALTTTQFLYKVTSLLVDFNTLNDAMPSLLEAVCQLFDNSFWADICLVDWTQQQVSEHIKYGEYKDQAKTFTFAELMAGLAGWAMTNRKGALSSGKFPDPREQVAIQNRRISEGMIGAIMVVPLIAPTRIYGTMGIYRPLGEPDFTPDDLALLEIVGSQIGTALDKRYLYKQAQMERERAETLRDIGLILSRSLDQETILKASVDQIGRVLPYERASVWLYDFEEGVANLAVSLGKSRLSTTQIQRKIKMSLSQDPIFQNLIQQQTVIIVPDTHADERWHFDFGNLWVRSWASAPIVVNNNVIGYLSLEHNQGRFYSEEHTAILSAIAALLSVAIHNAHLFEQLQTEVIERKRAQQELIHQHFVMQSLNDTALILMQRRDLKERRKNKRNSTPSIISARV